MEAKIKQPLLLADASFMIIDIENKTNKELKDEVYKSVSEMMARSKKAILQELASGDTIEDSLARIEATRTCKREFNAIIKQFYTQIDQLVPEE